MINKLKKHLKETPDEQLKKEWKEVEEWGNVGPSVDEFIKTMETKTIEVCDAININVNCKENDWDDIKIGGPATLGYDFYVSPDEDIEALKKTIEGWIKKYKRPFMSINNSVRKDFQVEYLWTHEKIEECIRNNEIW